MVKSAVEKFQVAQSLPISNKKKMNQKLSIVEDLNCIWTGHSICGEGPLWIPEAQALYWVDIDGCKAHRFQLEGGEVKSWDFPEKTGWILPRDGRSDFIAGCKSGIYRVDLESEVREKWWILNRKFLKTVLTMPKSMPKEEYGPEVWMSLKLTLPAGFIG